MVKKCLFVILLVLATVAPLNVTTQKGFTRGLLRMIENWNDRYYSRIPIDVPKLPYKIADIDIEHDGYRFALNEMLIFGLDDIMVQELTAHPTLYYIQIHFLIPSVRGHTGSLDLLYLYTKFILFRDYEHRHYMGELSVTITNLRIIAVMKFAARDSNTEINDFMISYSYDSVQTNLKEDFNKKIVMMLLRKELAILGYLNNKVVNRTISFLQGYSPRQLVEIFSLD